MPNLTANLQLNLQYTGPDGDTVSMPTKYVSATYQAQNHGTIDVPDATASATTYSIPFGTIATNATCGVIENKTGQELEVRFNGATDESFTIPANGIFDWGFTGANAGTPITSASVKTTALQSGAGTVVYHLFGDPT